MNWKLAGQICGVLSKIAFMIYSDMYEITDEEKEAFYSVLWDFSEGIVDRENIDLLLKTIKEKNGCTYWVSEEPLYFHDDEDTCCEDCDMYDKCHEECDCEDTECKDEIIEDILNGLDRVKSIIINFEEDK